MAKNKSHLLINEPPLQVLPSLAAAIGLNEAIVVQQLHYWLSNPAIGVTRDGERWIFNTYEEWRENFPFWSVPTIQRIFLNLEKAEIVVSAQLDAKKRDMRKFYRLNYPKLRAMEDINLTPSNASSCGDVNASSCGDVNKESHRLPETTTENTGARGAPPPEWGMGWALAAGSEPQPLSEEQRQNVRLANAIELFPQAYKSLARAFILATGIFPVKADVSGWCKAFRDQQARTGLSIEDVEEACRQMFRDKLTIKDPFSIVGVAGNLRAARKNKQKTAEEYAGVQTPFALALDRQQFVPKPPRPSA